MKVTTIFIIIVQLVYHIKCAEEDVSPCKYTPKDNRIVCDGSYGTINDEILENIGSKLVNKIFDKIRIFNTSAVHIRKNTFGKTVFRNIEISNNTLLETIDENAFKQTVPFWELDIRHNPILKSDLIFALYKSLNPNTVYIIDQNIKELPNNAFRIPEPNKSTLEAIILSNNKLKIIRKNSFIDCPNIRYIELNNNAIESIEDFGFNLTTSSTYNEIRLIGNKLNDQSFTKDTIILNQMSDKVPFLLHLENNSLTDLPELVFKQWFVENDHFIYAEGNKFDCECDMKWILHQPENPNHYNRFNGIYCRNMEKYIQLLTDKDFNCPKYSI